MVDSRKPVNIIRSYNFDMLRNASNDAKQRYHWVLRENKLSSDQLKAKISKEHFVCLQQVLDHSWEKVYISMNSHSKLKFESLAGICSNTYATLRETRLLKKQFGIPIRFAQS